MDEGEQLELPSIEPAKHPLRVRRRLEEETVTLRVPKETAAVINAAGPAKVRAIMEAEIDRLDAGALTPWSRERPPCSGWWAAKQHSAREHQLASGIEWLRWWYAARPDAWMRELPPDHPGYTHSVPHDEFVAAFEWRGLRAPAAEGYSYELQPSGSRRSTTRRHVEV